MLHYILQTVAFQVFFLIIYDLFLKKETFFNWNRVYLIGTAFLSFTLPFLKFESIKAIVPEPMVVRLPEVIIGEVSPALMDEASMIQSQQISEQAMSFSWDHIWMLGMLLAAIVLAYKLIKIRKLLHKNPKRWKGNVLMVHLLNSHSAFSFFNTIFLGDAIEADKKEHIVQHEMVHIQEKHSLDLLGFEILRIVFWFNPLIYMYQNRLAILHEFIADAQAIKHKGKSEYYQSLLSQVFETRHISFINPFFNQSSIKKRIIMLSKSKSKQIHLIKYALLIPMVMGMLMYTSSYASEIKDPFPFLQQEKVSQELSFQELVDKYYNEMVAKSESMISHMASYESFVGSENMYIESKDIVARRQAFMMYFNKLIMSKSKNEDELKKADKERIEKRSNRYETYEEYLAFKKTDEAKESWENSARDGELRLVVNDMVKFTEAEELRKAKKMAMIETDDFYYKLTTTNGIISTTVGYGKKDVQETKENFESYDIEVPYSVIEEVPIFQGCEDLESRDDIKQCTSDKIAMFVNINFNVDLATQLGLTGKQRISVIFKIGKNGKIRNVQARAPHPDLEAEAVRVIELLPDFTPGKQRGKVVTVPYSLPILFQVQDDAPKAEQKSKEDSEKQTFKNLRSEEQSKVMEGIEVPFAVVEEVPFFPSCETLTSNKERKQCTSGEITSFVNKNFDMKLAKELGLEGTQRILVIFKIQKDGSISDIKSRAPHPELEKEAIRVINALPKMQPGMQKGKPVVVPYSLPILFQVQ
jgi:bla regulator protein BlaR1